MTTTAVTTLVTRVQGNTYRADVLLQWHAEEVAKRLTKGMTSLCSTQVDFPISHFGEPDSTTLKVLYYRVHFYRRAVLGINRVHPKGALLQKYKPP